MTFHTPVLYEEVLQLLVKNPDGIYVDCTMGEGGHSLGILEKLSSRGRLVSLDQDPEMIKLSLEKYPDSSHWTRVQENFRNITQILEKQNISQVDGILADFGLSMFHYKASSRGFSFSRDDPLEMSFPSSKRTAKEIVNEFSLQDLESLLWEYAQEPHARRIASFILFYRQNVGPIETTGQLADIVYKAITSMPSKKREYLHPATKTFQALRIASNDELEAVEELLAASLSLLKTGGVGVFISYHSLEDRRVKHFIDEHKSTLKISRKKPIIPSEEEILRNKASRSARLRFFER